MYQTKDFEKKFTYHPPKDNQLVKYETIRKYGKNFAVVITTNCPDSREKSLAITKIEEAIMWANASIARNE